MVTSYLPRRGLAAMTAARSSGVMGPTREPGGAMSERDTIAGVPPFSSMETRASPTPSCVMTSPVSNFGFWRKVSAAAFTAF